MVERVVKKYREDKRIIAWNVENEPGIGIGKRAIKLLRELFALVRSLDECYSMHDFRTVPGEHKTNVIFEVAVPFDCKKSEEEVKEEICRAVEQADGGIYRPVVLVERQ